MRKIRDLFRPLFRMAVKPHIRRLCKKTSAQFISYKNKYKGCRCFIVANGPSLRIDDLDRLSANGEITIGMNRIYMLFDRTQWRPTFYMVQDPTIIRSCIKEIREQVIDSVKFVKVPGEPWYDIPNSIYFDVDYKKADKKLPPDFYDGSNYTFADAKSVSYTALQLAVYMGFDKIYLIGADCNYSPDNKVINAQSYPDKRMYDAKKTGSLPNMEYTFLGYEAAKYHAEAKSIKIYNATRGGKLEVFERVSLDNLLK